MSMWRKSSNSESVKPAEVSVDTGGVCIRRNYKHIAASGENPDHWEYEEWQMSAEQYDVFKAMQEETSDIEDALIELAELIAGGE